MNTEMKKKKKNLVTNLFRGDILENLVAKQFYLMALIVTLIIAFISNDYYCKKKLTEIEDLKTSLKDAKCENLIILTELTSASRQSQIKELLKKNNMELTGSTTPAFEIKK
jgi:cell division protein FtsL